MSTPPALLATLISNWDRDYEATLPVGATAERQPYGRILDQLAAVAVFRFQPYRNDRLPHFLEKLRLWIQQFPDAEKPVAFLLANRLIFVTGGLFAALQRRLFESILVRLLLDAAITRLGLPKFYYAAASPQLRAEIDATLFIGNSDSSPLSEFVHLNIEHLGDRGRRRLVGPSVPFWVYPASRASGRAASNRVITVSRAFERDVLATDPRLSRKRRIVVLEDFSGTGGDLLISLEQLDRAALPVEEVVIAPVIATQQAMRALTDAAVRLTRPGRSYRIVTSFELPDAVRCFGGSAISYLDGGAPIANLSERVRRMSERLYRDVFVGSLHPDRHADRTNRHGFGRLALAFSTFANAPDNSLPLIWKDIPRWRALFPRASRWI